MDIDVKIAGEIFKGIFLLIIGAWINHLFEKKSKLIAYYVHVSAFKVNVKDGMLDVFTHTVILRNSGKVANTNIRLHHMVLPEFNIFPSMVHHVEELLDGSKDIVIPILVPKEQITISYLYFPPLTYDKINAGIKSDQGFAQQISMVLQPKVHRLVSIIIVGLSLVGFIALAYMVYKYLYPVLYSFHT